MAEEIKNQPIEAKWQEAKETLIKETDPAGVVEEIRNMFFIGAMAMHEVYGDALNMERGQISQLLDDINKELDIFICEAQREGAPLN